MDQEYRRPSEFPRFLYVGSILQGDAIKTAIEAHRRDMPHCMGTLVWQHNDCWPVASWAGRDYYGRWKAQQYFSRYAYDDILVSPVVISDTLTVHVVSDRRTPAKGKFDLTAMKLDGTPIFRKSFNITAKPLTSTELFREDVKKLLGDNDRGDIIFVTTFTTPGKTYSNVAYSTKQKHMNYTMPRLDVKAVPAGDGYDVTIATDVFVRGVFLSLDGIDNFLSDNYFDILPSSSKTIHVTTALPLGEFKKQLKLISMGHIHNDIADNGATSKMKSVDYKPLGGD